MSSLTFARIINPVCSCGNYVGRLQSNIELKLVERSIEREKETTDEDLAEIITEMGITRICCRNTIIISPILRLLKTGPTFNLYQDKKTISERLSRLTIGNINPEI